jgi:hypothetical protein
MPSNTVWSLYEYPDVLGKFPVSSAYDSSILSYALACSMREPASRYEGKPILTLDCLHSGGRRRFETPSLTTRDPNPRFRNLPADRFHFIELPELRFAPDLCPELVLGPCPGAHIRDAASKSPMRKRRGGNRRRLRGNKNWDPGFR